jgi:hypothetical protein
VRLRETGIERASGAVDERVEGARRGFLVILEPDGADAFNL